MTVVIRHLQKSDLGPALEIERQANLTFFTVPGIGECQTLEPFAWRESDYLAAISQYKDRSRGTFDTRTLVAIRPEIAFDDLSGTQVALELVVGSMVYEIRDDGLEILRLSAVPGDDATRRLFVDHLRGICAKSRQRHFVRCTVSDGDWENLRFFVGLEWSRKLLPSFYEDGRDGWAIECDVAVKPPTANAR